MRAPVLENGWRPNGAGKAKNLAVPWALGDRVQTKTAGDVSSSSLWWPWAPVFAVEPELWGRGAVVVVVVLPRTPSQGRLGLKGTPSLTPSSEKYQKIRSEFPQQPESQLVLTQKPGCQILGGQGKAHTGPCH